RQIDRHAVARPHASPGETTGKRVRAGVPLAKGERLVRAEISVRNLVAVTPRHEAQLIDEEVPPVGHRYIEKAMPGRALPFSAGANSSALWAMSSSTLQRLPPASRSLTSDQPRIK